MFKFLFKLFSVTSFLPEEPKQNNVHFDDFDVERREKMKKSIAETNQYYETLQQSYAIRDDGFHQQSSHDYSSSDDCSYSSSDSGSCDSGSDGGCCGGGD